MLTIFNFYNNIQKYFFDDTVRHKNFGKINKKYHQILNRISFFICKIYFYKRFQTFFD